MDKDVFGKVTYKKVLSIEIECFSLALAHCFEAVSKGQKADLWIDLQWHTRRAPIMRRPLITGSKDCDGLAHCFEAVSKGQKADLWIQPLLCPLLAPGLN